MNVFSNLNKLTKQPLLSTFFRSIKPFSTQTQVQPWVETQNRLAKLKGELILSDQNQINNYAINLVKGYFRSTNKDNITAESKFEDHGLDSVDSLELCVQLEDELGYIIEAETMPKIKSVRHIINYIKHMEAYKQQYKVLPQDNALESDENWDDWLPNGESLKEKLFGYTKKKSSENLHEQEGEHKH